MVRPGRIQPLSKHIKRSCFCCDVGLTGNNQIDKMFILQRFVEGWEDGKFEEKIDIRDCLDPVHLYREKDGSYVGLREYEEARFVLFSYSIYNYFLIRAFSESPSYSVPLPRAQHQLSIILYTKMQTMPKLF